MTDQTPDTGDGALGLDRLDGAILSDARIGAVTGAVASMAEEIDYLRQSLTELVAERDRLRAEYVDVCETVAQMHAAAVGEVRGPIRGVVEDVADLRAEIGRLRVESDEVQRLAEHWQKRTAFVLAEAHWAAATCTCGTSPMTYEGPEPDCAVHGAVRAFNECAAERDQLRAELDEVRMWHRNQRDAHERARNDAVYAEAERDDARAKAKEAIDEALKLAEAQLVVIDQRDTLTARLAEAEAERDREDGLRAFAEGWAAEHAKAEHEAKARIAELEHAITQYLDSHGTAGTGELGKRLKAAVGRVDE